MRPTTSRALIVLALVGLLAVPAAAQVGTCTGGDNYNCFLLWAPEPLIPSIASSYGLTVVEQLNANTPEVVLVTGPETVLPEQTLSDVQADADVLGFEYLEQAAITESLPGADLDQSYTTIVQTLGKSGETANTLATEFSVALWNGYAEQPLADRIRLHEAHAFKEDDANDAAPFGWGVVAVIDTGVDPDHPVLADALVPGYDFILDQAGTASEWSALDPAENTQSDFQSVADQSYTTIVQGGGDAVFKNASSGIVTDQSYTTIVQGEPVPPAFGHGTMVAGIIRLVAPGAQIMPIRVFDGNGGANIFDIARAIHWATDNGANVINMSFSTEVMSPALMRAVNYASRNGVVCVSSAGNTGSTVLRFPAAFGNVIGIASTDDTDAMSEFSARGSDLVHVAGPGEGFMTTYPGGLYAAAWGTSFSAALVSGTVALLQKVERQKQGKDWFTEIWLTDGFGSAHSLKAGAANASGTNDWGYGLLDVRTTVENRVKGVTQIIEWD